MLNQIQFGSRGLYCVASGREGGIKRSSDVYFLRLSGVTLQTGWIKDLLKTFNSLFSRLLSWKEREQGVAACLSCSLYIYLSFSLQHLLHFSSQQYLKLFSHFFFKASYSHLWIQAKVGRKERSGKSLLCLSWAHNYSTLFCFCVSVVRCLPALEELYCLMDQHLSLQRTPSAGCWTCVEVCSLCTSTHRRLYMLKLVSYSLLYESH